MLQEGNVHAEQPAGNSIRAGCSSSPGQEPCSQGCGLRLREMVALWGRERPRAQQREGWTSILVAESESHRG